MKVLGIGEIIMDKSCIVAGYPQEGTKIQPQNVEYSIGGPVPSALILLAKLGVECYLMASSGNDTYGVKLKKKLAKTGVKFIQHLQKSTKSNTILVNTENGSRTIIRDDVQYTPIKTVPQNILDEVDLVIFDRHEAQAYEYVIANKPKHVKVVIDPSTEVSEKTMKMFQTSDFPIIPIEILSKIRRHEDWLKSLEYLYSEIKRTIIITAGENGSFYYDGEKVELIPAFEVDCVDANGAGDVFRGAFSYGILQNWELNKTVEFANLVAGLQCTKYGNGTAIPQRHEIEEFQAKAKKKVFEIEHLNELFLKLL